ncbi:uncharacterized protein LOC116853107 [Odontomachus brunneus]|uniref:uncharacterized protein LOC116853107 n=1 Tax=Odontomachus brunneus TaxID=486640 RepID=UPI0013F1D3AB|nr:uncharacterized protein LOC116853107 [Odontomachus brunneus]
MFDPLGWICPVLITWKILLQELWMAGVGWDDPLPEALSDRWPAYQRDISAVGGVRLPRWTGHTPRATSELHGFCDASERAYAAVVYLVVRPPRGPSRSCLLMAKSRVASVKRVTLPRLELCGTHLLARLLQLTRETLQPATMTAHCWSDSAVALAWHRAGTRTSRAITTQEYRRAEDRLVAITQRAYFSEELKHLRGGRAVPASRRLRQLRPTMDADGLLRVDGRLRFADLDPRRRHPILLPREACLTEKYLAFPK